MWPFEATALGWLGVAFVAAIVEVSVPHFGSMFVSLGAVPVIMYLALKPSRRKFRVTVAMAVVAAL